MLASARRSRYVWRSSLSLSLSCRALADHFSQCDPAHRRSHNDMSRSSTSTSSQSSNASSLPKASPPEPESPSHTMPPFSNPINDFVLFPGTPSESLSDLEQFLDYPSYDGQLGLAESPFSALHSSFSEQPSFTELPSFLDSPFSAQQFAFDGRSVAQQSSFSESPYLALQSSLNEQSSVAESPFSAHQSVFSEQQFLAQTSASAGPPVSAHDPSSTENLEPTFLTLQTSFTEQGPDRRHSSYDESPHLTQQSSLTVRDPDRLLSFFSEESEMQQFSPFEQHAVTNSSAIADLVFSVQSPTFFTQHQSPEPELSYALQTVSGQRSSEQVTFASTPSSASNLPVSEQLFPEESHNFSDRSSSGQLVIQHNESYSTGIMASSSSLMIGICCIVAIVVFLTQYTSLHSRKYSFGFANIEFSGLSILSILSYGCGPPAGSLLTEICRLAMIAMIVAKAPSLLSQLLSSNIANSEFSKFALLTSMISYFGTTQCGSLRVPECQEAVNVSLLHFF